MKLSTLKKRAQSATAWRGHRMRWHQYDANQAGATCRTCGATVGIETHPAPNGIDIGGSAVARNCPVQS